MSTMLSTSSGRAADPLRVVDNCIDQPAAADGLGQQLRRAQHPRQHRQPAERMGVHQRSADRRIVHADVDQPRRQPVRASTGPPERPGVGGQPGIDAMRHVHVDRLAPGVEQFGDHHGRRIRGRVNEIGGAEQLIGGVVVDHQQLVAGAGQIAAARRADLTLGTSTVTTRSTSRRIASGLTSSATPGSDRSDSGSVRRGGETDLDVLAAPVAAPSPARVRHRWCRRRDAHDRSPRSVLGARQQVRRTGGVDAPRVRSAELSSPVWSPSPVSSASMSSISGRRWQRGTGRLPGRFRTLRGPGPGRRPRRGHGPTAPSMRCDAVRRRCPATNVKVGVNRTPVPAPTLVRSTPLARSSAAAAAS